MNFVIHNEPGWAQKWMMERDWQMYSRFLGLMKPRIEETIQAWQQEVDGELERIKDPESKDVFLDLSIDEFHELSELRALLMNSFFSASYALFEHQLTKICEIARKYAESPFSVDDLKHSPLERAKQYLTILGVHFPSDTLAWRQIRTYQEIRNKLMHEGGSVSCRWKHFRYCKEKGIIDRDYAPRLVLTQDFCHKALNDMKDFSISVHQVVVDRWEQE